MENPYSPPALAEQTKARSFSFPTAAVFLTTVVLVIANYVTSISRPVGIVDLFMHVCFLISPMTLAMHSNNLRNAIRKTATPRSTWTLIVLLCIPVSFALSLTPYYSENQFEGFFVMNRFFGPYGWMQWAWLVVLGILPYAMLSKRIRSSRPLTCFLSATAICGHAHNAFWVFLALHSTD